MSYRVSFLGKHTLLAGFFALGLLATACSGESDRTTCGSDADCSGTQVCNNGYCEAESNSKSCVVNSDCPGAQICINELCQEPADDTCAVDSDCEGELICENQTCQAPDGGDPDTGGGQADTGTEDPDSSGGDSTPPTVNSITPSDGATGVGTDTVIEIEFSEAIDRASIFPDSVQLIGPNSRRVELTYDKSKLDQGILKATPKTQLYGASPYEVIIKKFVTDLTSNQLKDAPVSASFRTVVDLPGEHASLARKYAPAIYQGLRENSGTDVNADIPTTVDFDGDLNASNNMVNALESGAGQNDAHVYYHVTSTTTHHFLAYFLYYPTYHDTGDENATHQEHHFTAVTLMVDRETDKVVLVEGPHVRGTKELFISFTPESSGISEIGQNSVLIKVPDAQWKFEDQTHYPLYVKGGIHEPCHWYRGGKAGLMTKCGHPAAKPYSGDTEVVRMNVGDTAQSFEDATVEGMDGHKEMTYKLVPFVRHFWMLRNEVGQDALFDQFFTYDPNSAGNDRPSGYPMASAHQLPQELQSDETDAMGPTPFRWQPFNNPSSTGRGQWTLDPAYIFADHFNFSNATTTLEERYCYNFFFAIDDQMSAACSDSGGGGDAGMGDAGTGDSGTTGGMDAGSADAGN